MIIIFGEIKQSNHICFTGLNIQPLELLVQHFATNPVQVFSKTSPSKNHKMLHQNSQEQHFFSKNYS